MGEKASDETETLEEEVEKLDAALEYEESVEDDLSKSNTNLGRDLRNKNNEIKYYQCQLDLLMAQEKALKGGDKSKTVNLEEECELEIEEAEEEDDYDEEGSGDEEGNGDDYYSDDYSESEDYDDDYT